MTAATDPRSVMEEEVERIAMRRSLLPGAVPGDIPRSPNDTIALALSGGGIRSATVCLGLLQSLARARVLQAFDYLSTVSGGGYAGAFFGSLFARRPQPGEPALSPYEVLAGPVHRPTAQTQAPRGWQLWWLRNSGRYLAPTGAGDYLYAVALAIRNLVAVHVVLGVALLLMALVTLVLDEQLRHGLALVTGSVRGPGSGLFAVALAWLALRLLPVGIAYFGTQMPKSGSPGPWWRTQTWWELTLVSLAAALVTGLMHPAALEALRGAIAGWPGLAERLGPLAMLWSGSWTVAQVAAALAGLTALASVVLAQAARQVDRRVQDEELRRYPEAGSPPGKMLATRVLLTQQLASALKVALMLAGVAALVSGAAAAVEWLAAEPLARRIAAGVAGGATVLVAVVRKLAGYLLDPKRTGLPRLPLNTLALVLGGAAAGVLALAWFALAWWVGSRLAGPGHVLSPVLLGLLAVLVPVALVMGKSFQFLNLSSIQNLYASRLVRAYLGASNPARAALHDPRWSRLSDTHPGDNLPLSAYYENRAAPLHLINVTVNETVSPQDPLVQRDRHGRPLCITPGHLCIDGEFHPRPRSADAPSPSLLQRMGRWMRAPHAPPPKPEALSLGAWIGISGAAFSTGIGRGTTLGKALLLGLANVRLGHWWDAGPLALPADKDGADALLTRLAAAFRTQAHLLAELSGRFSGRYSRYWYLSDGGHFDNTGVYELLRRRVGLVLCADNGADPAYQHEDLANLMRIARIDFGCEFRRIDAGELGERSAEAARWAERLVDPRRERPRGDWSDSGCLSLYWVSYPDTAEGTVLAVVKPRLVAGAPVDLQQYAQRCPAFPQESTVDQFFSEEQWESYRKLGELLGAAISGVFVEDTRAGPSPGGPPPEPPPDAFTGRRRWLELRDTVRALAGGADRPAARQDMAVPT